MAMYMCPVCGMGVSSADNHKCEPKPIPFSVFLQKEKEEKERDNPFFKGYKSKSYFRT